MRAKEATVTRYSAGDWYGVVTPGGVALLPQEVPLGAVERIWLDLRAGGGLGALLDGLVGVFGTSLSRLPEFGVIALSPDGEVRVAIRGQVTARLWLLGETEPTVVTGTGVTTWNERLWTGVGRAELSAVTKAGELLPVVDGVMNAGLLSLAILDFDTEPPVDRDEPAESAAADAVELPPASPPPPGPEEARERGADRDGESEDLARHPAEAAAHETPGRLAPVEPVENPEERATPVEPVDTSEGPPATQSKAAAEIPADVEGADPPQPAAESFDAAATVMPEPEAAPGHTTVIEDDVVSDYDRILFGETMIASAESAAVRVPPEPTDGGVPGDGARAGEPAAPAALDDGGGVRAAGRGALRPLPGSLPPLPAPLPPGLIAGIPSFGAPPPPAQSWSRPQAPPPPPAGDWDDHDGETVMVEGLRSALAAVDRPTSSGVEPPRLLVPGQPPIVLNRSAIVGTRPRLTRVQGGNVPNLVVVTSPKGEISRSHVEIRVEQAAVLAVDLDSTNGTVLLRAGADPQRLHPGEPSMLVAGDRIDLGDGVLLAFEGLA